MQDKHSRQGLRTYSHDGMKLEILMDNKSTTAKVGTIMLMSR